MSKPTPTSHPAYFQKYIDLVPEEDLTAAFQKQYAVITAFLSDITEDQSNHTYAPGKWTIKELMQHITDTERIFAYRSLCFARNEKASLPGFDENEYAAASNAANRTWKNLVEEFLLVRKSTEMLFQSFTDTALQNEGVANNNNVIAMSMGFTSIGHVYHHINILKEKYLQ